MTIRTIKDIPEAIKELKTKLPQETHEKMWQVETELEIELGFAQFDHIRTNPDLSNFPGLDAAAIHIATQRGLNAEYPPRRKKDNKKTPRFKPTPEATKPKPKTIRRKI